MPPLAPLLLWVVVAAALLVPALGQAPWSGDGETCAMTVTVPASAFRAHCSRAPDAQAVTQVVQRQMQAVQEQSLVQAQRMEADNTALRDELKELREEYKSMVKSVAKMEEETRSWREILEWPLLDIKLGPENISEIILDSPTYADCSEVYLAGHKKPGIYSLEALTSQAAFLAFCSDGWTILQRRFDGSVEFYRNWNEYSHGFGELSGEFWLGLENIHHLTSQGEYDLKVETLGYNNKLYSAVYRNVRVGSEVEEYALHVSNVSETNYLDILAPLDGVQFSTWDNDHDSWWNGNCADYYHGAWWYDNCGGDLNRRYCGGGGCMSWGERPVSKSLVMVKQSDFTPPKNKRGKKNKKSKSKRRGDI